MSPVQKRPNVINWPDRKKQQFKMAESVREKLHSVDLCDENDDWVLGNAVNTREGIGIGNEFLKKHYGSRDKLSHLIFS